MKVADFGLSTITTPDDTGGKGRSSSVSVAVIVVVAIAP